MLTFREKSSLMVLFDEQCMGERCSDLHTFPLDYYTMYLGFHHETNILW